MRGTHHDKACRSNVGHSPRNHLSMMPGRGVVVICIFLLCGPRLRVSQWMMMLAAIAYLGVVVSYTWRCYAEPILFVFTRVRWASSRVVDCSQMLIAARSVGGLLCSTPQKRTSRAFDVPRPRMRDMMSRRTPRYTHLCQRCVCDECFVLAGISNLLKCIPGGIYVLYDHKQVCAALGRFNNNPL